jgi:hypothetical protein
MNIFELDVEGGAAIVCGGKIHQKQRIRLIGVAKME